MVKAQASGVRYVLLMTSDGLYVSSTPEGLAVAAEAGDGACWTLDRSSSDGGAGPLIFHHPSTKVTMQGAPATLPDGTARGEGVVAAAGIAPACTLRCPRPVPGSGSAAATGTTGASYVSGAENAFDVSHFLTKNDQFTKTGSGQAQGTLKTEALSACAGTGEILADAEGAATFLVMHGPDRLPTEYLAQLRANGYCLMPSLIAPPTIAELRRIFALDEEEALELSHEDKNFASPQGGAQASATVTKVMTHPIVTWLAHEYMHEDELRVGGGPAIATLQPQQNADGSGGWHSDFPYSGHHTFSPDFPEVPMGRYPGNKNAFISLLRCHAILPWY